ncbi:MAG: Fe2+-dependent dioxygenase, partial [Pseudomonadota bacterium]
MVSGVLSPSETAAMKQALDAEPWRDGKVTAGRIARQVKYNEQADLSGPTGRVLRDQLHKAITGHVVVKAAARPRRVSTIMVSRTAHGGYYGRHVDNALMGEGDARLRTDLSFTLFLTPTDEYKGGELIIHSSMGEQRIKGDAGDMVLYPSSDIHEVTPVTDGERVVAVGWIESVIADGQKRAVLFDLENLRVSMRAMLPTNSVELLTLDKTIANLLRMWAK